MKKVIILMVLFSLLLVPFAYAAEEQASDAAVPKENNEKSEASEQASEVIDNSKADSGELQLNWQDMDEMQIALILIKNQIDYLMDQVEKSNGRINSVISDYENRMEKERERAQESIEEMKAELKQKDQELSQARQEVTDINKKMALFNSENGVYLKILIGFLAGLIVGVVVNTVMSFINRRKQQKS